MHVVTGCDTISSFYGIGKRTVWKREEKNIEVQGLLLTLTHESLNKFIIKYVYNDKNSKSFGEMRTLKWNKMKNRKAKSFSRLGPVIYQTNILLNFQSSDGPTNPLEYGYEIRNKFCVPLLYTKPALPDNLFSNIPFKSDISESNSDSDESIDSTDEGCGDDEVMDI